MFVFILSCSVLGKAKSNALKYRVNVYKAYCIISYFLLKVMLRYVFSLGLGFLFCF